MDCRWNPLPRDSEDNRRKLHWDDRRKSRRSWLSVRVDWAILDREAVVNVLCKAVAAHCSAAEWYVKADKSRLFTKTLQESSSLVYEGGKHSPVCGVVDVIKRFRRQRVFRVLSPTSSLLDGESRKVNCRRDLGRAHIPVALRDKWLGRAIIHALITYCVQK